MRDSLRQLLAEADNEFSPNLSSRLNIDEYVDKIISNSTIIPVYENGILNAFISFYCNDYENWRAYLSIIIVRKNYRNRGVGRLLIEYVIEFLKKTGFRHFSLEVDKQNEKTLKIYQKLGFKIFEEKSDSFLMEKKLI